MLAGVEVGVNLDLVNGDTSSIAALVANDGGDGVSLREAVLAANNTSGADEIAFDPTVFTGGAASLIQLTQGELAISGTLTLDASALSSPLTLDANGRSRVLIFSASTGDLTIDGLTITGGVASGVGDGGGIDFRSSGTLTVNRSEIVGNSSASNGGGIFSSGDVRVTNSAIRGNSASTGGGIESFSGNLTFVDSAILGNTSDGRGGGIATISGDVTVINSTIHGNRANDANGDGGGIAQGLGGVTVINSTVSGNVAGGRGGGVAASRDVSLVNSTVFDNASGGGGGGVFGFDNIFNGRVRVENSIVAGNTAAGVPSEVVRDPQGQLAIRHSLIGNAEGLGAIAGNVGNLTGTAANPLDPLLDALADNGGPVPTHALLLDSPAIDAGSNALAVDAGGAPLRFDQRGEGFDRIGGGTVDMGAIEGFRETPSFVVTTGLDIVDRFDQQTSLREAVLLANNTPSPDTITFDPAVFTGGGASLIRLTQGELGITQSLTIDGSAATGVTITGDANGDDVTDAAGVTDVEASGEALLDDNSRVLRSSGFGRTLKIDSLTITGGVTHGVGSHGAGILLDSTGLLAVINSTISGNTSGGNGGGFDTSFGSVTVTSSTISGNVARNEGGGIFTTAGDVTVSSSAISGNTTGFRGGGISTSTGNVTVSSSAISGNAAGDDGGGINNSVGDVTLIDSTIQGNAGDDGGGIRSLEGDVTVINSTVSGNSAARFGGGVFTLRGPGIITLVNSTVVDNFSDQGGAVFSLDVSGSAVVENSIIAGNRRASGAPDIKIPRDRITINSSLIGDTTGLAIDANTGTGNLLDVDPRLGPLADNGGPTLTHALLSGSPAINAGNNALAVDAGGAPLLFDQRGDGFDRINTGAVDIGAFELVIELASLIVTTDQDVVDNLDQRTSLREAVLLANSTVGADTITFDPSLSGSTITLAGTELGVTDTLTIDASSLADRVTIDADAQSRVLNFDSAVGDLTLDGLIIAGGRQPGSNNGGGVRFVSDDRLTVRNSVIRDNEKAEFGFGGGVFVQDGELHLVDSVVENNRAPGLGGGVFVLGDAFIASSQVIGNRSDRSGGSVIAFGLLTVTDSLFSGNHGEGSGGGVSANSGAVVANSTFSGNSAGGAGGGIQTSGLGALTITNSTIVANESQGNGGGVSVNNVSENAPVAIQNTIVAGNTAAGAPNDIVPGTGGSLTINHSLIGNADNLGAMAGNAGNLTGTTANPLDPQLGELADNGGSTLSHAALLGSPVVGAGNNALAVDASGAPLLFDQRGEGFNRIIADTVDIGAFESQRAPVLPGDYNLDGVVDAADYTVWRDTLGATGIGAFTGADGNGDGAVAQADYDVWRSNFGARSDVFGVSDVFLNGNRSGDLADPADLDGVRT